MYVLYVPEVVALLFTWGRSRDRRRPSQSPACARGTSWASQPEPKSNNLNQIYFFSFSGYS